MALEPGLYLGLPEEQYFADPAVSYSDCRRLLSGAADYWLGSVHNPQRAEETHTTTDPMAFGKRQHCFLLEPEAFHERYLVRPLDAWREPETRQIVQSHIYKEMVAMREAMMGMPEADMLLNRAYGYPEVTVVWDDEEFGIRCRARQDFFCWEWTVDYKTAQNVESGFIQYAFRRYKYEVQAAHYTAGRRAARKALKEGKGHFYGDFSEEFMRNFEEAEDDFFIFLFQKKDAPHTPIAFTLDEKSRRDGEDMRAHALQRYVEARERHGGFETPWHDERKGMREFSTWYGFNGGEL